MINKEIILNADGSIYKDFIDRNIPQYQNNQVSVNVLIPSACFTGLENYAVLLGVSRTISGVETTLNTLIMTASKSITIDDVSYVKYSAILSYSYTDKISTLKVSPYIQTTATTTIDNVSTEVISIQQSFTNSNLNVIKSVLPQYDASLEEGTTATTLATQIAAKKIYSYDDTSATSWGQHYYNILLNYNPYNAQYRNALIMSRYDGKNRQYFIHGSLPFNFLIELAEDGLIYKIDDISYTSGTNTYTYTRTQICYKQSEVDAIASNLQSQITTLSNTKVNKTQRVNGHELSGNITITKADVGLGNVSNYSVEHYAPSASGSQLYITSKAVYDALVSLNTTLQNAIDGKASVSDFNDLDSRLDTIEALIGSDDGDDDNIINTLKEIISSLSGLGEDANILSMINSKADQTDFNTLDNQINDTGGIKDKVDFLWDRENAYCEIKNVGSTIDILTTDWEANADTDFPYKWELTNGYLTGATNAIVVFSLDSDTSLISSTIDIDETNGKVILYASDLPSDTISIEKIAVFNDLNAYINYSNTVVQQTTQNTNAISEINNVKLPNYIQKSETSGLVKNDGTIDTNTYIQTSATSGLVKNDGTIDTTIYVNSTSGTDKGNITNTSDKIELTFGNPASSLEAHSIITMGKVGGTDLFAIGQKYNTTWANYIYFNGTEISIYSPTLKWSTDLTTWKTLATLNDLTDYIQKSNTSGLVKNDGTIETNVLSDNQKNFVKDEYNKTLNLFNPVNCSSTTDVSSSISNDKTISIVGTCNTTNALFIRTLALKAGTYTISLTGTNIPDELILWNNGSALRVHNGDTFTISNLTQNYIQFNIVSGTTYNLSFKIMINEGSTALPYQEYNGAIAHQKDVESILLWQNATPNSSFTNRNAISINGMNNYKYIVIAFTYYYSTYKTPKYVKFENINGSSLLSDTNIPNDYANRVFTINKTNQTITFDVCNACKTNVSSIYTEDGLVIPLAIYGTNVL